MWEHRLIEHLLHLFDGQITKIREENSTGCQDRV
jgi:hypothetical protein